MNERSYIAIDLKSFYASAECVERGLDPMTTRLVVADPTRTDKTICLAVSPALKAYGIPGRPRLFEVVQAVKKLNSDNPSLNLDYIVAPPRMSLYMQKSTEIYGIYMKYVAPEDMHVYSCDEVFLDVTAYLKTYGLSAHELAMRMIRDVLNATGITATAGIGTNMYLCKIAMDIVAKHMPADKDGVRIAELDEHSYRRLLWSHTPITDFWRVGHGTARRLAHMGLYTMGDIARYSEHFEDALYRCFGINAELLIDHAWGWEPCTIAEIKAYRPQNNSLSTGQVLMRPYSFEEAAVIVREMTDGLSLQLVEKRLDCDQLVLHIGYDTESLKDPELRKDYKGEVCLDRYDRAVPKPAHGSAHLPRRCASSRLMIDAALEIYERVTDPRLLIRRVNVIAEHVLPEGSLPEKKEHEYEQLDLFTDYEARSREEAREEEALEKEHALQLATLKIREKYGKNALLKGTNFNKASTARERNAQIGGHRA
ncbi:MAG: DNA methylase [Lachnospiraceae bacterium]|nr:DNA methylase [Lachnospiraceae bacterium]